MDLGFEGYRFEGLRVSWFKGSGFEGLRGLGFEDLRV